jgi:DNA invertase Pin-like site-specific DNA recombinase
MTAAIYARKSTDQNVPDEEKSITRQIDRARAYAIAKGWAVADAHVYVDDGISGAEFVKRPGFIRLMNALKPRPGFQVLIMSEESRLGRESIEVAYALKQLAQAGVRVFLYLEDRERTIDSPPSAPSCPSSRPACGRSWRRSARATPPTRCGAS